MNLTAWEKMALQVLVEKKIQHGREAVKTDTTLRESEKLQWLADWERLSEKLCFYEIK